MSSPYEKKIGNSTLSWQQLDGIEKTHEEVFESWEQSLFLFKEENIACETEGLRPPQLGGIFAALGYEKSDDKGAASIVMPTGTGKTETILSIVVAGKFKKTLVVVPSDPLRKQTQKKFIQLGLLRQFGLITTETANPVVATIKHGVNDDFELLQLLQSNVIVASASALAKFPKEYLLKLTKECSHLIVDEAHHVTAVTWARVKSCFQNKPVFQFTATPFRSDCSRIEGKIIFNYSLKAAQHDGYFKPIEFHPVREFVEEKSDQAIANKAIELLKADLDAGLNHIVMARARTIKRAEKIFELYAVEKELNPVLLHNNVKKKNNILENIKRCKHRIIICVDMLGEGFDLPQLKISAIHDPHKSINIMLQFTGRFTRKADKVGTAKFIANIANPNVNESLEELYREDSDWNILISDISAGKIKDEKDYQEFRSKFSAPSKLLDLGLTPSISTTIYKMKASKWTPANFQNFSNKYFQLVDSTINDEQDTLIFSVKSYIPVGWASSKELFDEFWGLYIAYYDKELSLLFIHSSDKDGLVKKLVKLLAGNAIQIKGEHVFRALAGLKRLKLQNVGLNKNKQGLRYSMHTGTEINEQIPDIEAKRAIKSNIFGKGYEDGGLVSVGCSHKGKVWAMDSDSVDKWVSWCKIIGRKILDDSIDTNQVLKTAMQTEELKEFPDIPVLLVEWPVEILRKNESTITISSIKWKESLVNCELAVSNTQNADTKMFAFDLVTDYGKSRILASLNSAGEMIFRSEDNLRINFGEQQQELSEYFNEYPPTFFLSDTSIIDGGLRYYPTEEYAYLYDKNNIDDWDWSNIDISKESQTEHKLTNSIQYHTIQQIKNDYDVVFDDDGSGEIADIVSIKNIEDKELIIDLFHCKYCPKNKKRGRYTWCKGG
ncbi:MAG: DEAD/DEAH box helicase family protein [Candidatus Electrothrix aestuarii]|uniref:DEAD/DEAH box helicase family protein n=1 Tax=Candidatus Electrothrix aestuarii TaxID=3062594 RepID=A0AAU8LXS6_9BACT